MFKSMLEAFTDDPLALDLFITQVSAYMCLGLSFYPRASISAGICIKLGKTRRFGIPQRQYPAVPAPRTHPRWSSTAAFCISWKERSGIQSSHDSVLSVSGSLGGRVYRRYEVSISWARVPTTHRAISSLLKERVDSGEIKVRAVHWLAFMYNFTDGYDPNNKQNGLYCGLILVHVRSLFLIKHIIWVCHRSFNTYSLGHLQHLEHPLEQWRAQRPYSMASPQWQVERSPMLWFRCVPRCTCSLYR